MAKLCIKSIVCEVAEENDKDEIYLKLKGQKIWPQDKKYLQIDVDESIIIDLNYKISKPGHLTLELWDYDLATKDDHLGDFHIEIKSLEPGEHTEMLILNSSEASRASYYLIWELS